MKQLMGLMDPKQCIAMLMMLIEDRAKGDVKMLAMAIIL